MVQFTKVAVNRLVPSKHQATFQYQFVAGETFSAHSFGLTVIISYKDQVSTYVQEEGCGGLLCHRVHLPDVDVSGESHRFVWRCVLVPMFHHSLSELFQVCVVRCLLVILQRCFVFVVTVLQSFILVFVIIIVATFGPSFFNGVVNVFCFSTFCSFHFPLISTTFYMIGELMMCFRTWCSCPPCHFL